MVGHLRLFIQQALMINARNIEIQPEQPVLFILDELPALGYLSMVEKAFGLDGGLWHSDLGDCPRLQPAQAYLS